VRITRWSNEQYHPGQFKAEKGTHELKHHLEIPDADACMDGKQCVSFGLDIDQLKKNIEGQQY
jgi:hypothetical protein